MRRAAGKVVHQVAHHRRSLAGRTERPRPASHRRVPAPRIVNMVKGWISLPNGNQISRNSDRQKVQRQQRLVARADLGIGGHAGQQRRQGGEPTDVVVRRGDQPLHRAEQPVRDRDQQACDGQGRQEEHGAARQIRPGNMGQLRQVVADQAADDGLEEQDVRQVQQQGGEQADVKGVADHLQHDAAAEGRLRHRPGDHHAHALPGVACARLRQIAPAAEQDHAHQPPHDAEQTDGDRHLHAGSASE